MATYVEKRRMEGPHTHVYNHMHTRDTYTHMQKISHIYTQTRIHKHPHTYSYEHKHAHTVAVRKQLEPGRCCVKYLL